MKNAIKKFWDSEDGMGVVEVVLITIVLVGLLSLIHISEPTRP